tara:strand:+ start:6832 stop:8850 length:2019 start_codon:yes stop_codon:yes gene_type:complete
MDMSIRVLRKADASTGVGDSSFIDITKAVSREQFPKAFTKSLKGEAFFDFSVKGFTFKVIKTKYNEMVSGAYTIETNTEMKMGRYDLVLIMNKSNNEVVSRGFVDTIEDWHSSQPKIKYMPDAVRLKDIKAGVITSDEDDEDEIWEMEVEQPTAIDEIVVSLLDQANTTIADGEHKLTKPFSAVGTIPQPSGDNGLQSGANRFLGTILHKLKKTGMSFNLAKMFIDAFDGSYFRHKANSGEPSGYEWHYEVEDAGIIKRILINKGQWLSMNKGQWMSWEINIPNGIHLSTLAFGIPYPNGVGITYNTWTILGFRVMNPTTLSVALQWTSFNVNLGNVVPALEYAQTTWHIPSNSINIPSNHVYIPCIGASYDLYYLAGGDMTHVESYVKSIFPIPDADFHVADTDGDEEGGDQTISSLISVYGERWDNSGASSNITQAKMGAFVKDEGSTILHYRTALDWDENNTYAILKTKKAWNDIGGSEWLVAFETPFDFYQRIHYKNETPSKILRDLCVVTNRLLHIDKDNKVWLMERNATMGGQYTSLNVDRKWFTSRKVKVKRDQETEIRLSRYKKDSEGKVQNYGIVLREAEWEFLQSFYKDQFSGDIVTNEVEILKIGDLNVSGTQIMPSLLNKVNMNDNGTLTNLGIVIREDIGLEHSKYKYTTQYIFEEPQQ